MSIDYQLKNIVDQIALVGELEHLRRHAERSAVVAKENDKDFVHYLIIAEKARDIRRKVMAELGLDELDHCMCKSASCIRQLAYETDDGNSELLKELDELVDKVWGHALDMDLSGCQACREDATIESETTATRDLA